MKWLSFFKHTQPNPDIRRIWDGLFLNLVATLIPFIFIAPVSATLTCAFLLILSFGFRVLKWRLYGPLTYIFSILIVIGLRTTLSRGPFSGEFFATAFSILATMKSFNLRKYGDGVIFLILTLGVNSSVFLLDTDSSFIIIVWAFGATLWTVGNLLRINLKNFSSPALLASLKSAAYATLYTLPLLFFLFYIFQKFSHMPLYYERGDGLVGISRTLEPGKISKLTETSSIAMRVKLNQNDFPLTELYWRGQTLSHSHGMRWGMAKDYHEVETPAHLSNAPNSGACFIDQVIYPQRNDLVGIRFALDEPIYETLSGVNPYFITSNTCTQEKYLKKITKEQLWPYLKIDGHISPQVRELVGEFKRNSQSQRGFLGQIFLYFRNNNFKYQRTFKPLESSTTLDDFLFKTRVGFCEHYAAAFATLARVGGIPSRVVTGFQGGSYNRFGDYWVVGYRDAHAWVEIWDKKTGWTRFDPTTVVAPHRISEGYQFFGKDVGDVESIIDAFFFWLRGLFDHRETLISLDDLTFDPFYLVSLGFVIFCWFVVRRLRQDYSKAVPKQFKKLNRLLSEKTLPRGRAEGYENYRLRLTTWLEGQKELRPLSPTLNQVFKRFILYKYSSSGLGPQELKNLYRDIKILQRAIKLKTNFFLTVFKRSA